MQVHPPRATRKDLVNRGPTPNWRSVVYRAAGRRLCDDRKRSRAGRCGFLDQLLACCLPPATSYRMESPGDRGSSPSRSWYPLNHAPHFGHAHRDAGRLGWHALDGLAQRHVRPHCGSIVPWGNSPPTSGRPGLHRCGRTGFPQTRRCRALRISLHEVLTSNHFHPLRAPSPLTTRSTLVCFPPPPRAAGDFCRSGLIGTSMAGGSSQWSPGWPGEREAGRLAGWLIMLHGDDKRETGPMTALPEGVGRTNTRRLPRLLLQSFHVYKAAQGGREGKGMARVRAPSRGCPKTPTAPWRNRHRGGLG